MRLPRAARGAESTEALLIGMNMQTAPDESGSGHLTVIG